MTSFLLMLALILQANPQKTDRNPRNVPTPTPSPMVAPPQVGTTSTTGPHSAILNWSNPSCTTTQQCTIQVYRAQCTSTTTCPTWPSGTWAKLNMTAGLVPTIGSSGTSWNYTDSDPTLQDSTTYAWVATNTYVGGTNSSGASTSFVGSTNAGVPPAPTLSSNGNSVN